MDSAHQRMSSLRWSRASSTIQLFCKNRYDSAHTAPGTLRDRIFERLEAFDYKVWSGRAKVILEVSLPRY